MTAATLTSQPEPHLSANAGTETIASLLAVFHEHPHFLLTSHSSPDGDAVGSVLALAEILEQLGITVDVLLRDPVPHIYHTLPNVSRIRQAASVDAVPSSTPIIILECDSVERTGLSGLGDAGLNGIGLAVPRRTVVNIDHHTSGRPYGLFNWIDPNACAVAAMVYRIALAANATITPSMATCLYTAVLSDTGGFTIPSTSSDTFALAYQLTLQGANPGLIARSVYYSNPLSKTRLLGAALSNLHFEASLAWSWVTAQQLHETGADAEDCEGVINHLIGIDGAEAAVFLREIPSGQFRLSIRSKGRVDVAIVAESLGGGGHHNASGCTLPGPLTAAVACILGRLRDQL